RNSSRSISPGDVGGRSVGSRRAGGGGLECPLVIVRDLDLVGMAVVLPPEADAVLVGDADAVLPGPVAAESLEPVSWRNAQRVQRPDAVQLLELAPGHRPAFRRKRAARAPAEDAVEDLPCHHVGEGAY